MTVVESIRANINASCDHTGKLNKEGCLVKLTDAPNTRVVIDFDKKGSPLGKNDARCDFLFAADVAGEDSWIVPLELKKGRGKVDEVVKQLQAGATATERLVSHDKKVRFRPILASGGHSDKYQREKLRKSNCKIRFHNRNEIIRLMNCGGPLMNVLKKKA